MIHRTTLLRSVAAGRTRSVRGDERPPLRPQPLLFGVPAPDGFETWAYAVVRGDGVRVRLPLDDWVASGLEEGRRIPVRIGNRPDRWLLVTAVVELPPVVWVTLSAIPRARTLPRND